MYHVELFDEFFGRPCGFFWGGQTEFQKAAAAAGDSGDHPVASMSMEDQVPGINAESVYSSGIVLLETGFADNGAGLIELIEKLGMPLLLVKPAGDKKTPEGEYVIDSKNAHSRFHLALHISYPNTADRERARKLERVPEAG